MINDDSFTKQIIGINPEPIGIFDLHASKHEEYKKMIINIFESADNKYKQKFKTEPFTEHICNNLNQNIFVDFPLLNKLKIEINQMIIEFIKDIGYFTDEIIITDAWLNNASAKSKLEWHYHANSVVSGNYFVNYNPNYHSPLLFWNDRVRLSMAERFPSIQIQKNSNKNTVFNTNVIGTNPKEGQIILWRSQLIHGYDLPNKSDNRLTLSFNSIPKICTDGNGRYSFKIEV